MMRIHDFGPRTDIVYPPAKGSDGGWQMPSRWGSRPPREFGRAFLRYALLLAGAVLAGMGLASFQSCAVAKAVAPEVGRIDQVWLGFALDPQGLVPAGCSASKFALGDPIHLSMQVNDAKLGSMVHVRIRDVVTNRLAWSEARAVPAGRSHVTFAIGRKLAQGSYRAESTLGDELTSPRDFVVHERRPIVQ